MSEVGRAWRENFVGKRVGCSRVMPLPSFMMSREAMTTSMSVLGSPGVAESLAMAPLSLAMALGPAAPTRPMGVVWCGSQMGSSEA